MDVILPDQLPEILAETAKPIGASRGTDAAPSELARFSQKLRALSSLNTQLICMDVDQPVYQEMVHGVGRVMNIEVCALFMRNDSGTQLVLEGVHGSEVAPQDRRLAMTDVNRPAVQAFQEEYLVQVEDIDQSPGAMPIFPGVRSLMALPIIGREGAVGAFVFARPVPGGFDTSEVDLAGMLVDQMAYQLENFRLVQQLSYSRDAVIHGMARLAESRGGDIGGHLERMCAYSRLLAQRLQKRPGYSRLINDEWLATLTRAAALHDIGKVGIPDAILLKPARLTDEEFTIMRTHASLGGDILSDLMESHGTFPMLEMGVNIAMAHHERWDGTGYPRRIAGTDIPLSARIVAVADVYDALTSKRVYKKAWSQEETLAELKAMAGTQFDPDLVSVFVQDPAELEEIRLGYPD